MKYVKEFLKYFYTFPAFTSKDVRLFLRKKGTGNNYYKTFMHNMVKSRRVFAIGRGRYTIHDDPMLAGFAFSPFYYGMETALTYYKLWNYVTPISIVTTNRVRKGEIVLLGRNANVRRIKRENFFGYTMVQYTDNLYIPVSDIEKTLIDSIYFHSRFSKEVYAVMAKRIDRKKLDRYLKHYNDVVKKQIKGVLKSA